MPGDEVEVALAVVVDQPRAVAVDERDGEARVGREERRAGQRHCVMPTTAVRPIDGGDAARARR